MKIGIVAYAENTGLGNQSLQFYEHLNPDKTMLLDRSGSRDNEFYPERYGREAMIVQSLPDMSEVNHFIRGLEVVVFFERPVTNYFVYACRQAGVKTVVIPNFEYYAHWYDPNVMHVDALIAPSLWRKDEYLDPTAYVPTPVEIQQHTPLPEVTTNFLHIGGRPIHPDRNGTKTLLQALRYVESSITMTVTCQDPEFIHEVTRSINLPDNVVLDVRANEFRDWKLMYKGQHALIMPRRFGGQCMPANEALGFGIPVIMPDISPNNQWLPKEWLIPAEKTDERKMGKMIDVFSANERDLAAKIDEWSTKPEVYGTATEKAQTLAVNYSWDEMTPKFMRIFEQLCYH